MPKQHTVKAGEYLSGIARKYGFQDWKTVYEHPKNSLFRRRRPNPNVIFPGDQIYIPDLEAKPQPVSTNQLHRFRLKSNVPKIRLVFEDPRGRPLANEPYELVFVVDDEKQPAIQAFTDGSGALQHVLPHDCEEATLYLGRQRIRYDLDIGDLDPALDECTDDPIVTGIQARLNSLGYFCGQADGIWGPKTERAVKMFQRAHMKRKDPNGDPDPETCRALQKAHLS